LNNPKVKQIMDRVKSFPGMPATAAKILPLLRDPEAGAARVEAIIQVDPGLTANLLKLANSAYFGLPSQVGSVRQAILFIGWKRLSQLVLTMCMSGLMKAPVPGYNLPRGNLWRHSVAVSTAADVLVRSLALDDADEVFTAALLHDIGKLVLGAYVQEDLDRIEQMVEKGLTFEVAEYIVLGTTHAEIGARILQRWSLPQRLVNAVSLHHDPENCRKPCVLSDVVHVADIMVRTIGYGTSRNGNASEPAFDAVERLELATGRIQELAAQTLQEVTRLSEMMN
jgi:putative nucleotidyltransferase with HDIG domain